MRTWRTICGDAITVLQGMPTDSVSCAVTSPPYYRLRSYLPEGHPAKEQELGWTPNSNEFIGQLADIFDEVRRVLKPHGTCWIVMGDTYQNKELLHIPARLGFTLQERGWFWRSEVIWHKPNVFPEGVKHRPSRDHETILMLTKTSTYYYDQFAGLQQGHEGLRKLRSVWSLPVARNRVPHFAAYPLSIPLRCIMLSSSSKGECQACDRPVERVVTTTARETRPGRANTLDSSGHARRDPKRHVTTYASPGWMAPCACNLIPVLKPAVVLDPFAGIGTTGRAALRLGRSFIGIELNPVWDVTMRQELGNAIAEPPLPLESQVDVALTEVYDDIDDTVLTTNDDSVI